MNEELKNNLLKFLSPEQIVSDASLLTAYGVDWTTDHAPNPSLVVFPNTTQQVSDILKTCALHNVAVVPSGGRTGLAGGAVAKDQEVVLSLDKLNHLGKVNKGSQSITVGAGAIHQAVNAHCLEEGLFWPIDLASKGSCQIGGNLATNAGGIRVIRYGHTRKWVLGLEAVLMSGEILKLNGALEKNNAGWDLMHLFIGSEGILGVITEATLKLTVPPAKTETLLFGVENLNNAISLLEHTRGLHANWIHAFEYWTHDCHHSVSSIHSAVSPLKQAYPGYVLVEVEESVSSELFEAWLEKIYEKNLVKEAVLSRSSREAEQLWAFRENISESLSHLGWVHKNDISVPIDSLVAFSEDLNQLMESLYQGYQVFVFGHLGDGNLHINVVAPKTIDALEFHKQCREKDANLYALIRKYQGSIAAEHGIGLIKKEALKYSRSPEEIGLLKALKNTLDPQGLLNPNKMI